MEKTGIKSEKRKILVIGSSEQEFCQMKKILSNTYRLKNIHMEGILQAVEKNMPDLFLFDTTNGEQEIYEKAAKIKENPHTAKIPILFINATAEREEMRKGLSLGCADYIRKPFEPDIMKSKIATQIELYGYRTRMEEMLEIEKKKVVKVTLEAIKAITKAEEAKDAYTNEHSERVADYAVKIGKRMKLKKDQLESLRTQALLHDIGKIGIPDNILKKHQHLSEKEYDVMKRHVQIGNDILKNFSGVQGINEGALYHHERWDGKGYLSGKMKDEIPLSARIIAIADAFDAMYSGRVYRDGMQKEDVVEEIRKGSGTQFDPTLVEIFLEIVNEKV